MRECVLFSLIEELDNMDKEINFGYLEMLKEIKKTPNIYLTRKNLKELWIFMIGYDLCYSVIFENPNFQTQKGLQEFVQKKYGIQQTSNHFLLIIDSLTDKKCGVYVFFEILEEFSGSVSDKTQYNKEYIKAPKQKIYCENISDLYAEYQKILSIIRLRYQVYITTPSLQELEVLLNGFSECATKNNLFFKPHSGFCEFVREKYLDSTQESVYSVLTQNHDETEAFYVFFQLLDDFLQQKSI